YRRRAVAPKIVVGCVDDGRCRIHGSGTPATTAQCPTSSRTAANLVCSHADFVTALPDLANADLAGLPKSYIIQQMADYKSVARGMALPGANSAQANDGTF